MQAMQYTIKLPSDYDMDIIRQRVRNTGHLMDGFDDLFFKVYLISEKSEGQLFNKMCIRDRVRVKKKDLKLLSQIFLSFMKSATST